MIRLTADAIAGSDDRALEFNFTDHPVILDLCGHSIDRNLGSETSGGNVLTIKGGELILRDSEGGGTITGGYNLSDSGGGVIVNGGIFTMEAGSITGNRIKELNGAGVNLNDGTFKLKGGSITGNYAYDAVGAGVYMNSGSFLVSGEPTVMGNFTGTLTAVGLSGQQSSNIYLNHGCLISVEGSLGKAADFGVGA